MQYLIFTLGSLQYEIQTLQMRIEMLKDRVKRDQRKFRILEQMFANTTQTPKQAKQEIKGFGKTQNEIATEIFREAQK